MALSEHHQHQVALLIETIPFVAEEPQFALKGGTAINSAMQALWGDMPAVKRTNYLT
jgi:hypothetical protein